MDALNLVAQERNSSSMKKRQNNTMMLSHQQRHEGDSIMNMFGASAQIGDISTLATTIARPKSEMGTRGGVRRLRTNLFSAKPLEAGVTVTSPKQSSQLTGKPKSGHQRASSMIMNASIKSDLTFLNLIEDPECAYDEQGLEVRRRKAREHVRITSKFKGELTVELIKVL